MDLTGEPSSKLGVANEKPTTKNCRSVAERLKTKKDPLAKASRVFPHPNKRLRDLQPPCYPPDPQPKMPVKMQLPTWAR
ncbi:MAG: hypothetical protein OXG53_02315 [Chloroflexi bacterium]|nr:hypothetical protein [Chloroflexota bacterium]